MDPYSGDAAKSGHVGSEEVKRGYGRP